MSKSTFLHRPALIALLDIATSEHKLWTSQSALAADCGIAAPTLSYARKGERGLSDAVLDSLTEGFSRQTGTDPQVFRDALVLPTKAVSGDVRSAELVRELKAMQNELTRLTRLVMTNGD